ncbi:MAG: hypothetical protein IT378_09235 [Sandaracinaceae bacterium]|nr:hypothetical protein [Sandaracinaceae bacterium]
MEISQFDLLLHDAEVKLKRLKALYEQWFQGIERMEPLVPRKDLDRLFAMMNKEKPRNTAARFRLSQLQATYVTYQAYWQRIVRQIEEGTYERDKQRALRLRAVVADRGATKEIEIDLDLDADQDVIEDEIASALRELEAIPSEPAPRPTARPALSAFSPFAMKPGSKPAKSESPAAGASTAPAAPKAASAAPAAAPKAASAAPVAAAPRAGAIATFAKPRASAPGMTRPQLGAPPGAAVAAPSVGPSTASNVAAPKSASASDIAAPVPPRPVAPAAPPTARTATGPTAPAAPRPAPPVAKPPPAGGPDDERTLRKLYDDYVAARKRNNEGVEHLRYEAVAESVKKMVPKLKDKYGDKKIDFEVVVQNGRVGFRPKVGD